MLDRVQIDTLLDYCNNEYARSDFKLRNLLLQTEITEYEFDMTDTIYEKYGIYKVVCDIKNYSLDLYLDIYYFSNNHIHDCEQEELIVIEYNQAICGRHVDLLSINYNVISDAMAKEYDKQVYCYTCACEYDGGDYEKAVALNFNVDIRGGCHLFSNANTYTVTPELLKRLYNCTVIVDNYAGELKECKQVIKDNKITFVNKGYYNFYFDMFKDETYDNLCKVYDWLLGLREKNRLECDYYKKVLYFSFFGILEIYAVTEINEWLLDLGKKLYKRYGDIVFTIPCSFYIQQDNGIVHNWKGKNYTSVLIKLEGKICRFFRC